MKHKNMVGDEKQLPASSSFSQRTRTPARDVEISDLKDGMGRVKLIGTIVARNGSPQEGSTTLAIDDGTGQSTILAALGTEVKEKDKVLVVGTVFTSAGGTLAVRCESIVLLENVPSPAVRSRVKKLWDAEFRKE